MKIILEHIGSGEYKPVGEMPSDEEMKEVANAINQSRELKGYPWEMNENPKKIIYVRNDNKGILNFVI